jgi:hypothetical protein
VNQSDQPIEIQYKIKMHPGPFSPDAPATIDSSLLGSSRVEQWSELTADQYKLDHENRTVLVQLMPKQALRIARVHHYTGHEDLVDPKSFFFPEAILLKGAQGEVRLTGDQARINFAKASRVLYLLTYR